MILDPRHPPHRLLRHRNLCAFSSEARTLLSGPLEHPTSEPRKTGDAHYPKSKVSRKGRTTCPSLSEPPPSWSEGTKRAELSCLTLRVSFMFPIVHSCRPCPELSPGSHRALCLSSKFLFKGLLLTGPPSQTLYLK